MGVRGQGAGTTVFVCEVVKGALVNLGKGLSHASSGDAALLIRLEPWLEVKK